MADIDITYGELAELRYPGAIVGKLEHVKDEIVDHRRWTITHKVIFKNIDTGKYYKAYVSVGATEYQEGDDYNESVDNIVEVEPITTMQTIYVVKGEAGRSTD